MNVFSPSWYSGTSPKVAVRGGAAIVPVAVASASKAPVGLLRVSVKVSPWSSTVSSRIGTETVFVVSLDEKVNVPLVAV